jgi:hypothetical protein
LFKRSVIVAIDFSPLLAVVDPSKIAFAVLAVAGVLASFYCIFLAAAAVLATVRGVHVQDLLRRMRPSPEEATFRRRYQRELANKQYADWKSRNGYSTSRNKRSRRIP